MIDDALRKVHPEQFEETPTEKIRSASAVPDFVTKTKEYVKQHPEVIREVAGDEIAKVEAWLDTFPVIGDIAKAKLNEFLGGAGIQGDGQGGVKDAPGQDFIPSDGQGQGEGQEITAEEDLTISEQKEVIEFMADLSEQGFDLARIQNAVRREWGLEYHYLTIKRMLAAYYGRPESEGNGNGKSVSSESLRVYQKLLEKNADLARKVAELTAKVPPEIINPVRKGLIRRFWGWLW